MAYPDGSPKPWYLTDLTEALYLDVPSGNVVLRTGFSGDIIISGNVNIPGTVTVSSSAEDPVHVHLDEIGTSGILTVPYMPISGNITIDAGQSVGITGTVNIGTMPEVEIKNDSGNPISISKDTSVNSITNRIYVSGETDVTIADSTYEMNVAQGLVAGQYQEFKNGYATGISQGDEVTIWNEVVLYPWSSWTVAQQLYIISTSASDTGQVLRIEGLDASYNKITEDVTTNGTSAVATSQNFLRLNRCYTISGSSNVGTITQRLVSGSGTVVGSMAIGFARNKGGFFTVPNGYTAYIMYGDATQFRGGAGNIGGVIKMCTRTGTGPFLAQVIAEVVNGLYRSDFIIPLAVPEKTDIDVRILVDGNGTQATCSWQMVMIPN